MFTPIGDMLVSPPAIQCENSKKEWNGKMEDLPDPDLGSCDGLILQTIGGVITYNLTLQSFTLSIRQSKSQLTDVI